MAYDAFRKDGGPTLYPSLKTPETVDVLEAGLIFSAVILLLSLLLVLPGLHGKEIFFSAVRICIGVFVTTSIMLCNFGQAWEVAYIDETQTQYRAGLLDEINATVGVSIGLRSVNITLKGKPDAVIELGNGVNETVNYNERFGWDNLGWVQGRAGFGPNAGKFNQEFRAGQFKGTPYPILWVAEYFTLDGEGIRWGRHYRQAGFFTHVMIWLAFPMWLLSMILMHMVTRYGGYLSICTGICLLIGNILYATIRNPLDLKIPIGDKFLIFTWGWCFWLNLITGIICTVIGVLIFILDIFLFEKLSTFFGSDVLQDFEEIYVDQSDIDVVVAANKPGTKLSVVIDDDVYEDTEPSQQTVSPVVRPGGGGVVRQFKKRETAFTKKLRLQKSRKTKRRLESLEGIEMSNKPQRKYEVDQQRNESIIEGDEEVFEETYENTGYLNDQNRRQIKSRSGVLDNNVPEQLTRQLLSPKTKPIPPPKTSFQYRSGSGPVDNNVENSEDDDKFRSVHFED